MSYNFNVRFPQFDLSLNNSSWLEPCPAVFNDLELREMEHKYDASLGDIRFAHTDEVPLGHTSVDKLRTDGDRDDEDDNDSEEGSTSSLGEGDDFDADLMDEQSPEGPESPSAEEESESEPM